MHDRPTAFGPLAAIDLGSNSFRLEIGELDGAHYRPLDRLREAVRLGAALDAAGRLGEEAIARGLDCLARFAERLERFGCRHVRAVATQALREAVNRDTFLERARARLGHPIDVIAGHDEARLIYAGVARLQPSAARRLVVDVGGRSTELVVGRGAEALAVESIPIGCVGISMRRFVDGRLDAAAFRAAQDDCRAAFGGPLDAFAPSRWDEALGSSGTVGALARLLAAEGITDGRVTPEAIVWGIERCLEAGHVDRLPFASLTPDRRAVVPGGLAILAALFERLGLRELKPARGALRHGVLVALDAALRSDASSSR